MTTPDAPLGGTVRISTDHTLIALFDPVPLRDYVKERRAWWESDPFGNAERQEGRLAIWPLGGRGGFYRVRLGTELNETERAYDRGTSPAAPLQVSANGQVFLGPAERLPGDGYGDLLSEIPDKGGLLPLPPGGYTVTAHVLDWRPEARFWNEENEPTDDAPPDFVLVVQKVDSLPPAPEDVRPLLELLPQKKPKGGERVVVTAPKIRGPILLEDEKPGKKRGQGIGGATTPRRDAGPRRDAVLKIAPGKPGELRDGARVRHGAYGMGTVLFVRDGFPKVRVKFDSGAGDEFKVDRSELTVLS